MTKVQGFEVGHTDMMKTEHAKLLQDGKRRMPREGELCDNSCFFAFACQNFNDHEICRGFKICSNGKLDAHVRRNFLEAENQKTLSQSDRMGIQSYIRMYQNTDAPEIKRHLVPVILRSLKPPEKKKEPKSTMLGFQRYIITENKDGSKSLSFPEPTPKQTSIQEPEPECITLLKINEEKRRKKQNE